MCWNKQRLKNILNINGHNFDTNYQILIIFGANISDQISYKMTAWGATTPNVSFCTTRERQTKQNVCWNEWKKRQQIPSIQICGYQQPGLTIMQQFVYQMTFRDVDEFKKRLLKSGLI